MNSDFKSYVGLGKVKINISLEFLTFSTSNSLSLVTRIHNNNDVYKDYRY